MASTHARCAPLFPSKGTSNKNRLGLLICCVNLDYGRQDTEGRATGPSMAQRTIAHEIGHHQKCEIRAAVAFSNRFLLAFNLRFRARSGLFVIDIFLFSGYITGNWRRLNWSKRNVKLLSISGGDLSSGGSHGLRSMCAKLMPRLFEAWFGHSQARNTSRQCGLYCANILERDRQGA